MSIFPNCVKNVRIQALSDAVKSSRLMQKMFEFLPLKIGATEQSLNDRNKMADERPVYNCDLKIDRDMCTLVIMYIYVYISLSTLIFEKCRGGGGGERAPPRPL